MKNSNIVKVSKKEDILSNNNDESAINAPETITGKTENAQETEALPSGQSFAVSEKEWADLKAMLDKRYAEIASLLRYNKTKDESIQRLGAEIQKYRDGFAFSALKPFINALIAQREDCRKSLRDAAQHGINEEKAKKYIDFLVSGIEEMISNLGLEREGDAITMNGKPLSGTVQPKKIPDAPAGEEKKEDDSLLLAAADSIKSAAGLIEYLNKSEAAIRAAVQEKAVIDKTIAAYIDLCSRTDAEHYFALAAPIARKLYVMNDKISNAVRKNSGLSGEEIIQFYNKILNFIIKETDEILTGSEVIIETPGEVFDTQKHKLLKAIPADDEKLDRTIANTYTDCYSFEGKVIYQSKVDVYKFKE